MTAQVLSGPEVAPGDDRPSAPAPRRQIFSPTSWLVWGVLAFFFVCLLGVVGMVVLDAFGTAWFTSWFPQSYTTHWFGDAWSEFGLGHVLYTTFQVAVTVVVVSVVVGVPAGYALARRSFPGKKLVMLLFVLPILVPPMTYGISLATLLYKLHLAPSLEGVILANLVPCVPFVILTMTPFIEQIDPKIEAAARMCGASTRAMLLRVLTPLLVPGILAASILVLVRTIGMFELTFLTAGPTSQTLVVALYNSVFSAGIRTQQSIDAMAVIYTGSMLVLLLVALRFVNPTQLVTRMKEPT
jgi:putative spermidine/putrescine transport system permease protein